MRVEVLAREEIEEKMLMTPGDIVMMLNEMGGMRVQATSPSLGAASVRIQGMRGRYTRFLSDGLPLFGEQPGGLGLLQIPPMDLGQVEVIKGVASALYGAGRDGRRRQSDLATSRRNRRARHGQPLDARRDRCVLWLSGACRPRVGERCSQGATGRNRPTSTTKDGRIFRAIRAGWCGRACSGRRRRSTFFATAGATGRTVAVARSADAVLPATGLPYRRLWRRPVRRRRPRADRLQRPVRHDRSRCRRPAASPSRVRRNRSSATATTRASPRSLFGAAQAAIRWVGASHSNTTLRTTRRPEVRVLVHVPGRVRPG